MQLGYISLATWFPFPFYNKGSRKRRGPRDFFAGSASNRQTLKKEVCRHGCPHAFRSKCSPPGLPRGALFFFPARPVSAYPQPQRSNARTAAPETAFASGSGMLTVHTVLQKPALPNVRTYTPYANLHCVVLTGMDETCCYLSDPMQGDTLIDRSQFESIYTAMGSRAVVLR